VVEWSGCKSAKRFLESGAPLYRDVTCARTRPAEGISAGPEGVNPRDGVHTPRSGDLRCREPGLPGGWRWATLPVHRHCIYRETGNAKW